MKETMISAWQDGYTLPQLPGLYQRQFSVVRDSIFDREDDEKNYHYFDGEVWYLYGTDKWDALHEYERMNPDDNDKYLHAPWRGVVEVVMESKMGGLDNTLVRLLKKAVEQVEPWTRGSDTDMWPEWVQEARELLSKLEGEVK